MTLQTHAEALGPELVTALERKGYAELTKVQRAVLDPAVEGRDLRITSQTGSGKTIALGFAVREFMRAAPEKAPNSTDAALAKPAVLVLTPTRELAHQVEAELRWLFAALPGRVVSVTGGASYRDERRALASGPALIVGTPGRLRDHLERGAIDASHAQAVVLDEADRMLDLGFREDIETILQTTPSTRRTHLVSATIARGVRTLADAVQRNAARVEGSALGAANADIDHVVHLVDPRQKLDAVVNLLLLHPDAQTLIFARTRADVGALADELSRLGFTASAFSGEMDQAARNRTIGAFKRGALQVLIATDVAARGIDIQDVTRVIHVEMPTSADAYTHRSGRTGRAGRKGVSAILVPPAAVVPTTRVLRSAGIALRVEPLPSADDVRRVIEDRVISELTTDPELEATADEAPREPDPLLERMAPLAARLAERLTDPATTTTVLTRLLARSRYANLAQARQLRPISMPAKQKEPRRQERGEPTPDARSPGARSPDARSPGARSPGAPGRNGQARAPQGEFVPFRVSFGAQHGADPRRVLALVCRRGDIRGKDVGPIRIERTFALVGIADSVAETFEQRAAEPDPRDPRVSIRRDMPRGHAQRAGAAPSSSPRSSGTRPLQRKRGAP